MNPPIDVAAPLPFKDRRTGLILFGVLQIFLGGLCTLLLPLMFWSQAMQARMTGASPQYRLILPAAGIYGALAAVLVGLGIGSILTRRWARALSLILSWSWLAVGVITMIVEAILLPRILSTPMGPNANMPPGVRGVILFVTFAVLVVMFVILPGGMVLFYRSPHVKATCETRDPVARWTDACPLPVLGLVIWLGFGAASLLLMPLGYRGVVPCFGVLLSGAPGTAMCVVLAVVWAYLARAAYRLQPMAWWLVLGVLALFTASALITFTRIDLMEMYRLMGYPEQQIEQIRHFNFFRGPMLALFMVATMVPVFGYLLWVKRFFRTPA